MDGTLLPLAVWLPFRAGLTGALTDSRDQEAMSMQSIPNQKTQTTVIEQGDGQFTLILISGTMSTHTSASIRQFLRGSLLRDRQLGLEVCREVIGHHTICSASNIGPSTHVRL